jgi:hypothetical protein
MRRCFLVICVFVSLSLIGCAVHDGHEDEPAPIWWPTFMYHATTHPTEEEYDQTKASPSRMPVLSQPTAVAAAN